MKSILFIVFIGSSLFTYSQGLSFKENKEKKKVEILYNKKLLTAYCWFDSTEKPVLFPIKTLTGNTITRGYPVSSRAGERVDHPHHVGLWLNYESVNGLDFWNNSTAIAADKKPKYGSIRHQQVLSVKADKGKVYLKTISTWVDNAGKVLMDEITDFVFNEDKGDFVIDRSSKLTAVAPEVTFKDVKDGLLGLRVARQLEQPSKTADKFIDAKKKLFKYDENRRM